MIYDTCKAPRKIDEDLGDENARKVNNENMKSFYSNGKSNCKHNQ